MANATKTGRAAIIEQLLADGITHMFGFASLPITRKADAVPSTKGTLGGTL